MEDIMADNNKGDQVSVSQYISLPGRGLTYPSFKGILLEDAGDSEGWEVVEVENEAGDEVSVYCFSLQPGHR